MALFVSFSLSLFDGGEFLPSVCAPSHNGYSITSARGFLVVSVLAMPHYDTMRKRERQRERGARLTLLENVVREKDELMPRVIETGFARRMRLGLARILSAESFITEACH